MLRRRILSGGGGIDPTAGRTTIGGYEVVDLGLPSGLLWATCNVGATEETRYGDYYMYGKSSRKYNSSDSAYTGTEDPLSSSADTATQVMGSEWRMPTNDEMKELIDNTNYEFVYNFNGTTRSGGLFISKANPKAYVFFPGAGFYNNDRNDFTGGYVWSSTPSGSSYACSLGFFNRYRGMYYTYDRDYGFSVRGVHNAI